MERHLSIAHPFDLRAECRAAVQVKHAPTLSRFHASPPSSTRFHVWPCATPVHERYTHVRVRGTIR